MTNPSVNTLMPESVNHTLRDALLELKQQLVNLEAVISRSHYLLRNHVVKFKEQTIDFLYDIDPVHYSEQEDDLVAGVNENIASDTKIDHCLPKPSQPLNQHIVIKVSNHHYVPKGLYAQTIVTYKID